MKPSACFLLWPASQLSLSTRRILPASELTRALARARLAGFQTWCIPQQRSGVSIFAPALFRVAILAFPEGDGDAYRAAVGLQKALDK
jgi:hypothetical protein